MIIELLVVLAAGLLLAALRPRRTEAPLPITVEKSDPMRDEMVTARSRRAMIR